MLAITNPTGTRDEVWSAFRRSHDVRVAGTLMRKNMLGRKCLFFKGVEHDKLFCSGQHPAGRLQTPQTAKPAYLLRIGANRYQENGSRYLSLTRD